MSLREKESFDMGWKFYHGDLKVMHPVKSGMAGGLTDCEEIEDGEWLKIAYFDEREPVVIDEEEWTDVVIPHDWCVEGEYENDKGAVKHHRSHGYLRAGVGHYRKNFDIPESMIGKKIGIEFDGIFRNSTIWINGHELMKHESGYTGFYCDFTDIARYGTEGGNTILVRVDAREYEGWWYEGAGIYRHAWLVSTDKVHVKRHGTYVTTPIVDKNNAVVEVETIIENESFEKMNCTVVSTIINTESRAESTSEINFFSEETFNHTLSIDHPQLWSPETPFLYQLNTKVFIEGKMVDSYETRFGIRTIEFHADKGFLLNGKPYVIKGTCNHQDFAGVGVALPDSLIEYKIKLLKEMGCNAYRSAHHPATPELLDICDRMGMLVMDENRKLDSTKKGIEELEELLLRGRNHPSIFMWSMENEEILEGTVMGKRILETLVATTRKLDPTRPTIASMNHGWNDGGYSDVVDVVGYNYGQREDQDVKDHIRFPQRRMLGSESASCTVTRGIYERDDINAYCPEYGTHIPEWSCTVEKAWTDVAENPFLSGVFIWTGFDYRGEPTPYDWPNINSHFGVMDTCGFPKDNYHYLKSQWIDTPMIHILPHWTWEGHEGKEKEVWVYANLEEVELTLNGKSLGKKQRMPHGHLEWVVPYEAGVICAVGYNGGVEALRTTVETAGSPYAITLNVDKMTLDANGSDTACIEVSVVDEQGNVVPNADNLIEFSVEGPGKILGVGNGNPSSHEPDKAHERKVFSGKCLAIIQTTNELGEICVRAVSGGLKSQEIYLKGIGKIN